MSRTFRLVLLLALSVAGLFACGDEDVAYEVQTHRVRKGNLRIAIRQKGTIEARDPVRIVNPIFGQATILNMVPEGTLVKKGQKVFELDVQEQRDRLLQQEISASTAQQSLLNAEQQLDIQRQQNESNVKKAELNLLFAELDIKQYIEGDLPKDLDAVGAQITLAEEELKRASDTLNWSIKLEDKGYISTDKLESDRLAVKRREIDLDLSRRTLDVLNKYTSTKRKKELESELEEAKRELERVKVRANAAERQREADVGAHKSKVELERQKLERLEHQVENNVVFAPRSGLVVYEREGRGRSTKPLEPGSRVREGQTVVTIPDMERVLVDVDVHESSVHMVQLGQPVLVTTDTGESMQGEVEFLATIADSQSWYRNPDLKVYSSKVTVDNKDQKLRPGMNCYAEIIIEELEDVVSVPVQAVFSNSEKHFCYVKTPEGPKLREVQVGLHNATMIHVTDGITLDEEVFLSIPPDAEPVPTSAPKGDAPVAKRPARPKTAPANGKGPGARPGGRTGDRGAKPSAEDRKKMWESMTEEQREEMKKRWRSGGGQGGGKGGGRGGRQGGSGDS